MSKCLVHASECVDFVDAYQNWKDQDCPWCRVRDLEAALADAKAQRDSWKRIAESGLGITAETACKYHLYRMIDEPCTCSTSDRGVAK